MKQTIQLINSMDLSTKKIEVDPPKYADNARSYVKGIHEWQLPDAIVYQGVLYIKEAFPGAFATLHGIDAVYIASEGGLWNMEGAA